MSFPLSYTGIDVVGEVGVEGRQEEGEEAQDTEEEITRMLHTTRTVSQHFRALRSRSTVNASSNTTSRNSSSGKNTSSTNSNTYNSSNSNSSDRGSNSSSAESLSFLLPVRVKNEDHYPSCALSQELEKTKADIVWTATPQHGAAASRLPSNTTSSNGGSEGTSSSSSARVSDGHQRQKARAASRSRSGRRNQSSSPSPRQTAAGAAAKGPVARYEKGRILTAGDEERLFGKHLRVLCLNCYLIPPSISWNPHLWAAFWSCKRAHQRAAEIGQVAAQYDLVCLQEVWGTNMPALTAAVLPTHSILPETQAWGGVAAAEAAPRGAAAGARGGGSGSPREGAAVRRLSSAGSSSASSFSPSQLRTGQAPAAPARGGNAAWRCASAAAALLRWWGSELLDPCRLYCSRTGGLFFAWKRQKCAFLRLERQPFPRHAQVPFSNQNVTAVELDVGSVFPPRCRLLLLNTHFSVLSKEARDASRQTLQWFVKTLAWKSYLRFLARNLQGAEQEEQPRDGDDADTADEEDSSDGGSSTSSRSTDSESDSSGTDSERDTSSSTSGEGGDSSSSTSSRSNSRDSGHGSSERERRARRRKRKAGGRRSEGEQRKRRDRDKKKSVPSFLRGVAALLCGDFNIDAEKAPRAYQKLKSLDGAAHMRDLFLPQHNPNYPCQYTYFTQEKGTAAADAGGGRRRSQRSSKGGTAAKTTVGNTLFPWPSQGRIDYIFAIDDVLLSSADVQHLAQEFPPDTVLGEDYEDMEIPVLKDGSVRIFFEHIYCLGMDIVAQEPGTELSDHWPLSARITIGKPPSHEQLQQLPKPRREQLLRGYSFCCSTAYSGSRRAASAASRPAAAAVAARRKSSRSRSSKDLAAAGTARRQSSRDRQQRQQSRTQQGKLGKEREREDEKREEDKAWNRQLGVDEAEVDET